jgi:hypothetical protein
MDEPEFTFEVDADMVWIMCRKIDWLPEGDAGRSPYGMRFRTDKASPGWEFASSIAADFARRWDPNEWTAHPWDMAGAVAEDAVDALDAGDMVDLLLTWVDLSSGDDNLAKGTGSLYPGTEVVPLMRTDLVESAREALIGLGEVIDQAYTDWLVEHDEEEDSE